MRCRAGAWWRSPGTVLVGWIAAASIAHGLEVGGIRLHRGEQDRVRVTSTDWHWRGGAETFPATTHTLDSGRFIYAVRHNRGSRHTGIGLMEPTRANWYQSGMIAVLLNGEPVPLQQDEHFRVRTAEDAKGAVDFHFEDERTALDMRIVLLPGDDKLCLRVRLDPKVEVRSLAVRLRNYPAGFRQDARHAIRTPARTLEGKGVAELSLPAERAVFLSDPDLDIARDAPGEGPSAAYIDPAGVEKAVVHYGGYGAAINIDYAPSTREMRFCLWEFPRRGNDEAWARFQSKWPEAEAALADPATFRLADDDLLRKRVALVPRVGARFDWENVPPFPGRFVIGRAKNADETPVAAAPVGARVRAVHDGRELRLRVEADEPRMDGLVAVHSGPEVWKDDCVEVFLDANFDRETYYQFVVSASGEAYGWDTGDKSAFTEGWSSRGGRTANGWWVELHLPFRILGIRPEAGTAFALTVCRERRAGGTLELSTWTPPWGFHRPREFGVIVLDAYGDFARRAVQRLRAPLARIEGMLQTGPAAPAVETLVQEYRRLLAFEERMRNLPHIAPATFADFADQWEQLTRTHSLEEMEYALKIKQLLARD